MPKWNVLLIGSGGRESALAYAIRKSDHLKSLRVYPGNGGFPSEEILPADSFNLKDKKSFQEYLFHHPTDLVVVGPEEPLVDGISDWCSEAGVACFGPDSYGAQLEGSKEYAKSIMKKASVPTAAYESFDSLKAAEDYLKGRSVPIVIKADGLAAGKGVTVCQSIEEATQALRDIFIEHKFGEMNQKVVIEDFLAGEEASLFAICDGKNYLLLPPAQDHKRAFEGDKGPNTGGMGAYTPAPIVTESVIEKCREKIFDKMLLEMEKQGHPFKGLLYCGLMIEEGEPYVVEFNCRFGDPETQAILPLVEEDLLPIFMNAAKGKLQKKNIRIKDAFSSVVVLAAEGYPDTYPKSIPLRLPKPKNENVIVFHAGTKLDGESLVSSGGRIVGIAATGETLKDSLDSIYEYLSENPQERTFYRKDIAYRAL